MQGSSVPRGFKLVPDSSYEEDTGVPKSPAKAAAFDSWLAQGGTPFKASGRFKKGPFRGKNYDEAKAMFERMWATSPDEVKQKYADRTSGKVTDLAPSERTTAPAVTNASLNAARAGETPAQMQARQRASRTSQATPAPVANTAQPAAPVTAETPKAPAANNTGLTVAPAVTPNAEKFQTADTGDGAIRAAIAMQAEQLRQDAITNPQPSTLERATPPAVQSPAAPIGVGELRQADEQRIQQMPPPAVQATQQQSQGFGPGDFGYSFTDDMKTIGRAAMRGVVTAGTGGGGVSPPQAPQRPAYPAAAPVVTQTPQIPESTQPITGVGELRQADERRITGQPPMQPAQPQAVGQQAPATAPAVSNPAMGPPRGAMQPTQITGNAGVQPRVNPATSLPFGYRPGDDVAPAQAEAAGASIRRQEQAQASRPLPAPPVARPAPAAVRYADAQTQYQAGKAPATAMDAVYTGASGQDKAAITAQSLKRAASLPTTVNAPRAIPVTNPRRPIPAPPVGRPRFALAR